MAQEKVGIYAGTFDPVHAGHLAFALQAMERAGLDRLYFLPERRPRHKQHVEHFGHRVAMLRQAVRPHPQFDVLELEDLSFSVVRTLPKLRAQLHADQLVFLFGSDAITNLPAWPQAERLLEQTEIVIGCRQQDSVAEVEKVISGWPKQPRTYTVLESHAKEVSSGGIRTALRQRQPMSGLLKSVAQYSNRNWLYISLAPPASVDKP